MVMGLDIGRVVQNSVFIYSKNADHTKPIVKPLQHNFVVLKYCDSLTALLHNIGIRVANYLQYSCLF